MFTQMRTALVQDRIQHFPETPDEAYAPTLTHRDVLEFATIDGARACALDHKVGSITPGKDADIVLLRANAINTAPLLDPVATAVVYSDTSNVDSVFVAGRAVKRGGELLDIDLPSVVSSLEASRDHILSRGGLLPDWAAEPTAAA
jgi:cytosine/adenosine deaminase-related metal-dependent hydrolase